MAITALFFIGTLIVSIAHPALSDDMKASRHRHNERHRTQSASGNLGQHGSRMLAQEDDAPPALPALPAPPRREPAPAPIAAPPAPIAAPPVANDALAAADPNQPMIHSVLARFSKIRQLVENLNNTQLVKLNDAAGDKRRRLWVIGTLATVRQVFNEQVRNFAALSNLFAASSTLLSDSNVIEAKDKTFTLLAEFEETFADVLQKLGAV